MLIILYNSTPAGKSPKLFIRGNVPNSLFAPLTPLEFINWAATLLVKYIAIFSSCFDWILRIYIYIQPAYIPAVTVPVSMVLQSTQHPSWPMKTQYTAPSWLLSSNKFLMRCYHGNSNDKYPGHNCIASSTIYYLPKFNCAPHPPTDPLLPLLTH